MADFPFGFNIVLMFFSFFLFSDGKQNANDLFYHNCTSVVALTAVRLFNEKLRVFPTRNRSPKTNHKQSSAGGCQLADGQGLLIRMTALTECILGIFGTMNSNCHGECWCICERARLHDQTDQVPYISFSCSRSEDFDC